MLDIKKFLKDVKSNWIIFSIVFLGFLLIGFRFLLFSEYASSSENNARSYMMLVSTNALLPFLFVGVTFAQSTLYPKMATSNDENRSFFLVVGVLLGLATGFCNLFYQGTTGKILMMALSQFAINYIYQSARSDDQRNLIIIYLLEILCISTLLLISEPEPAFSLLFLYYALLLIIYIVIRIFKFKIYKLKLSIIFFSKCFSILIRQSPIIIKEYLDVILIGWVASSEVIAAYAFVILSTAPLKVFFSNITIGMNLLLAKYHRYYSNYIDSINGLIGFSTTLFSVVIATSICMIFFNNSEILYAVIFRTVGISIGFFFNMRLLDDIQNRAKFNSLFGVCVFVTIVFLISLIVIIFPLIEVFSLVPIAVLLLYSISNIFFEKKLF
jgi:hypothetical protein